MATMSPGSAEYKQAQDIIANLRKEIATLVHIEGADLPEDYYIDFQFIKDKGNDGFHFVGIKNFKNLILNDTRFGDYLKNTLVFLIEIPIGMAISLIMALAMNQPLKALSYSACFTSCLTFPTS
jgi:ABC-type sugar transport system permease subunit